VGLFLQEESEAEGNDEDVGSDEDGGVLELEAFEDPNVPEKGGLPPLPTGGVDFLGSR
jgi:hypothetical protein